MERLYLNIFGIRIQDSNLEDVLASSGSQSKVYQCRVLDVARKTDSDVSHTPALILQEGQKVRTLTSFKFVLQIAHQLHDHIHVNFTKSLLVKFLKLKH